MLDDLVIHNADKDAVIVVTDSSRPPRDDAFPLTPGMSLAYCAEPNNDIPRELSITVEQKPPVERPPVSITNVGKTTVLVQQDNDQRQDYGTRYCLELKPESTALYKRQTNFKIAAPVDDTALKAARAEAEALRKALSKQWDELQATKARVESLEKALRGAADALLRAYDGSPEHLDDCVEKVKDAFTEEIRRMSRWT